MILITNENGKSEVVNFRWVKYIEPFRHSRNGKIRSRIVLRDGSHIYCQEFPENIYLNYGKNN